MSTEQTMVQNIDKAKYDLDRTGVITSDEIDRVRDIVEVEILGQRAHTQKKMAWLAMLSMLVFTLLLFSPFMTDTRVAALSDLIGLFFIAQAGIVGAYMGVTAWMSSPARNRSSSFDYYSSRRSPQDMEDGNH